MVPLRRPPVEMIGAAQSAPPSGVEIAEDPTDDVAGADASETGDGGITITIADGSEPSRPRAAKGFGRNLADDLPKSALDTIAAHLLEGIEADIASRSDWLDTANLAARYLGIKLDDPSASPTDGTVCKVVATTMLEAAVKLWGTARAELLPVGGPVKVRDDHATQDKAAPPPAAPPAPGGIAAAPPPAVDRDALAQALETDLNWYLTVGDKEYYPDFSKMLLSRACIGVAFRKVHRCPLRRRPVSVWVKAQDLIVSNDCAHLGAAGRVTEVIRVRQSVMRRLQVSGHYRDIVLVTPSGETTATEEAVADAEGIAAAPQLPGDYEHRVYECYCELGSGTGGALSGDLSALDRDEAGSKPGFPLPYRVSIDLDSREVLEIRRNWKQDDEDYAPRRRYVKYGFVPGFGFYDLGLIHIIGNPTQAATMIQRACVDSGMFANFPGGLILKSVASRQQDTVLRPMPGQFLPVDGGGAAKIRDAVMEMPYRDPSPALMELGAKLEADARRLAGVIEIPVGEGRVGNTPVGTMMSYIEAISQVPGAVHKDDHITQQEEYELLRELLAEEPEALWRGNRTPARRWQVSEEIMDPDLVPAADPNTPSQMHRLMKVQGMVTLGAMPQFQGIADNRAIYEYAARVLSGDAAEQFVMPAHAPAPPPPDPRIVAAQINAQSKQQQTQAAMQKDQADQQAKLTQVAAEGQQRDQDRASAERRAMMSLEAARMKTTHDTANQAADRTMDHVHHVDDLAAQFAPPAVAPQSPGGI